MLQSCDRLAIERARLVRSQLGRRRRLGFGLGASQD